MHSYGIENGHHHGRGRCVGDPHRQEHRAQHKPYIKKNKLILTLSHIDPTDKPPKVHVPEYGSTLSEIQIDRNSMHSINPTYVNKLPVPNIQTYKMMDIQKKAAI